MYDVLPSIYSSNQMCIICFLLFPFPFPLTLFLSPRVDIILANGIVVVRYGFRFSRLAGAR
jgi:hypothetical protein